MVYVTNSSVTPVRIMGIDPGIAATGWGVIEHRSGRSRLVEHGVITTSYRSAPHARLSQIYAGVTAVIDRHEPDGAAIEELFGGINLKTALAVGQARGVAVLACGERGVVPHDYTALRIKQAVAGYGRAGKEQVQQMVKVLLCLPRIPTPDHAADALAVALCHVHSMRLTNGVRAGGAAATAGNSGGRPARSRPVATKGRT